MNQRKAKAIRKTALGLIEAKPDDFKDTVINHGTSTQRISGFRKAKRAAALIFN